MKIKLTISGDHSPATFATALKNIATAIEDKSLELDVKGKKTGFSCGFKYVLKYSNVKLVWVPNWLRRRRLYEPKFGPFIGPPT
jgi:hypothetical protein